ncbi:MAG: RtcB family protein, partial [Oscillospiraceae bacterium]|nr:RtcB family protein [Oscillospiraceae bacterium]
MIEIRGQYNTAVCYCDELEETARQQIQDVCDQRIFAGSKIRIMPDVHAGVGCTIGTTMTVEDRAAPNLVGVDIGCGMETVKLAENELDCAKLDQIIRTRSPAGENVRTTPHPLTATLDLNTLQCLPAVNAERAILSVGTLGGGNHFIEI